MEQNQPKFEMPPIVRGISVFGQSAPIWSVHLIKHATKGLNRKKSFPIIEFPAGAEVFGDHSPSLGVWVLATGSARLLIRGAPSWPTTSVMISCGDAAGFTETLAGLPYAAKLETITPCKFLFIPPDQLFRHLRKDQHLRSELIGVLSRGLGTAYARTARSHACDTNHRQFLRLDLCFC